jgi:glutaredoxin 2
MTLFTKDDCVLCARLKRQFDLSAMEVAVEVLGNNDAGALAHLAWHGLVEKARKGLPILVLDDSSALQEFPHIESHLLARAARYGVAAKSSGGQAGCESGSCALQ